MSAVEPEHISAGLAAARAALAVAAGPEPEPLPAGTFDPATEAALASRHLGGLRELHWSAVCPQRFHAATLADAPDSKAGADLQAWAAMVGPRPNLVLVGAVGVGKTHLALAAVRDDYVERGLEVLFRPVAELLDDLRPGGDPTALDRYVHVERLVLDDVGAERPTDWSAERLGLVINRRWMEERPVIATTNLEPGPNGELVQALGERTYSRLVGSDAVVVRLSGADRRRQRT